MAQIDIDVFTRFPGGDWQPAGTGHFPHNAALCAYIRHARAATTHRTAIRLSAGERLPAGTLVEVSDSWPTVLERALPFGRLGRRGEV